MFLQRSLTRSLTAGWTRQLAGTAAIRVAPCSNSPNYSTKILTGAAASSLLQAPAHVVSLLEELHARSLEEEKAIDWPALRKASAEATANNDAKALAIAKKKLDDIVRDKFIALDQDEAQFVFQLARASGAKNIVEAGTSYGISTIYLSLAVGANLRSIGSNGPSSGKVIATEFETAKAERARKHWSQCGEVVERYIELREGDILETLKKDLPPVVDMLLLDIWKPVIVPTLGAVIIADNTADAGDSYAEFFEYIKRESSGYTSITLPFDKGLEMVVYDPKR